VVQRHPEWFGPSAIPASYSGEAYRDPAGRWVGTVVSSFGLLYNRTSLQRLGVSPPRQWSDLTDSRLRGEVALADPTKSGAIAKAFEMILQQQMHRRWVELAATEADPTVREARAVREGWTTGLRLVQLAAANARYFTDSSQKPPIDVGQGDAAVGMCIDFFGRYEEEAMVRREGGARVKFVTPAGGSVFSVDPVALFRGAPHPELARAFIDFALSLEGQKLWNFRVGTPGGPERFALRRLPVRADFYTEAAWVPYRSDPDARPYEEAEPLLYHPEWTGDLFREMSFIIRSMCIDALPELQEAWRAVLAAGQPAKALRHLTDVSAVDYDRTRGEIKRRLGTRNKLDEMELARELGATFRRQYREARDLARESK
jgi:ABC-type Fe3+ transport system substrate-binding protein